MSSSPTRLPPLVTPAVDPKTGLPTNEQKMWNQELLQARSAWTAYTPTTAHLSAITVNDCAFQALGKLIAVRIAITGTSDGTVATITLPFKAKSSNQTFAVSGISGGTTPFAGLVFIGLTDLLTLSVAKYDDSAPANGVTQAWIITGVYEAQ